MNWNSVKTHLLKNISVGDHIDPSSKYRFILTVPQNESSDFIVSIGKNSQINFSLKMLKNIYEVAIKNNGIYNKSVIYNLYPKEVDNHGCYVHVIGNVFVKAGLMTKKGNRDFLLIDK